MAEQNTEVNSGTLDDEEREIEEILSKVDDTPLNEDDWNIIVIETESLSSSWEKLVIRLGLPYHLINNTIRPASNPWNEAINQWIKRNYNTEKFGLPSWRTLLKAVAQVNKLECKKLADKYRNKGDAELVSLAAVGRGSMFADSALGKSTAASAASVTAAGAMHLSETQSQRGLMDFDMGTGHSETGAANDLHVASLLGSLEDVKRLIEKEGFNPLQTDGKNGRNALHYAAFGGQLGVMKYFIKERGCNPTCHDLTGGMPLHYAAQCSHPELVQYLVDDEHVDPTCLTKAGNTPLHLACGGGNIDVVTFLVNAMTKHLLLKDVVEFKGQHGARPVHSAAVSGHLEVIKFFATRPNFDPLITDDLGRIALHCAAVNGHIHVVKYFIEHLKCNSSPVDRNEFTPLHYAASMGHLETVKYLILDQHCDPLCAGMLGLTPLHWAACHGQLEVIKFFVDSLHCPADIRAGGITMPIVLARDGGHHHVVQYLESITN